MKTKYFFLFLACIFGIQLQSKAEDYKLLFEPDTTISNHASFNKVIFLDLRHSKEYVGSLRFGMGTKPRGIAAAFPLDSMMHRFTNELIAPVALKDNNTLIIAMRDLSVDKKYNRDFEVGNLYLQTDFYLGNNDQYTRILSVDTLIEFGVGNKPMVQMARVFNQTFGGMLMAIAGSNVPSTAPFYTQSDIQSSESVFGYSYPVYHEEPKKGIYYSIESFLQNQPDDTVFVQMHNNVYETITDKFYTSIDGKKKLKSLIDTGCFAVYNGKKWYTPFGNEFKEMKFRYGNFYYKDFGQGLIMSSTNNYYYIPMGGGLVGALIGTATLAVANGISAGKNAGGRMGDAVFLYKLNPQTGDGIKVERLQ